jgi:hypothetical protein
MTNEEPSRFEAGMRAARSSIVTAALVAVVACGRSPLDAFIPFESDPIQPGSDTTGSAGTSAVPAGPDGGRDAPPDAPPAEPCGGMCAGAQRCVRGTFARGEVLKTGHKPFLVLSADLNGDGAADLVVGNNEGPTPNVFLGRGGAFRELAFSEFSPTQVTMALGDFNGDNAPDLALTDNFTMMVFAGKGNGLFETSTGRALIGNPSSMTAVDLDGDGVLDLALPLFSDHEVLLFKGDGMGRFVDAGSVPVGSKPERVVSADLDRDDRLDLIVVSSGASDLTVLPGRGGLKFGAARSTGLMSGPRALAVADFDGDGAPDAAVNDGGGVTVLLGDGLGRWRKIARPSAPGGVHEIVAADLDQDGAPDLVSGALAAAGASAGELKLLRGNGDGTFRSGQTLPVGPYPASIVAKDLNGDEHEDLAVVDFTTDELTIFLWNDGHHCE